MRLWKVLGLAGVAGVAATGVVVARNERRRRAYEPDDVRARLRQRHAEAVAAEAQADRPAEPPAPAAAPGCRRAPWRRPRAVRRRSR